MEIREKAQALIDQYTPALSERGVKILLFKRYFESDVSERSTGYNGSVILNSVERAWDRKKEKKYGYNYQKNQYHYLILTICPMDKKLLHREDCREYAFALKMVVRPHIGEAPRRIVCRENKILSRIEKQIRRILKKAENSPAEKVCQNTITDAFRYAMHPKYEYKEHFCGKGRFAWEMIFLATHCILVFGSLFIAWLITQ